MGVAFAVLLCVCICMAARSRDDRGVRITPDVIYGRKDGMALTLDVYSPAEPNGAGVLCAPSDIRAWVTDPPEAIRSIPELKPPLAFDPARAPDYSPALRVAASTAPVLLVHGDHDELVDVSHSRRMYAALQEAGAESKLVVLQGAGHAFTEADYKVAVPEMVAWFEKHL